MIIWRKFLILICDPEFKDTPTCSYVGFGGGVVHKLKKTIISIFVNNTGTIKIIFFL